jgi:hypothetical protein
MKHVNACKIIHTTIVLHNMCIIHKSDEYLDEEDEVLAFMTNFHQGVCPKCKKMYEAQGVAPPRYVDCVHKKKGPITPATNVAHSYREQLIKELWLRDGQE